MIILFDECFPKDGAKVLISMLENLVDPPTESHYMLDWLRIKGCHSDAIQQGVWDEDWPKLFGEDERKEAIIISVDTGQNRRKRAKGAPLHIVLPQMKIRGVFLASAMGTLDRLQKTVAVASVLKDILTTVTRSAPGTRFKIQRNSSTYTLKEWPVTPRENKMFSP